MEVERKEEFEGIGSQIRNLMLCHCCETLVKPTYHAQVLPSHNLNIPGLAGRYVNVACCPVCSETL